MIKGKQKRPSRICFECTHYEACQAWNVGTLVETDATHCVNYRASFGKTNADRIRAMTDEELANWLGVYCNGQTAQEVGKPCVSGMGSCEECWLDWLKQEAVSDG